MLAWSVAAFRAAGIGELVIAGPPGRSEEIEAAARSAESDGERPQGPSSLRVVEGGETRSRSVANAITAVETELVAIHDAARPLLSAALVLGVIETLESDVGAAGAIAAAPVTDTVKRVTTDSSDSRLLRSPRQGVVNAALAVERTVERGLLWAAQTPQAFRVAVLRGALDTDPEALAAATDEAMLVEAAGGRVLVHPASPENLKVTTAHDLRIAEHLLAA
jgi:2-C-methyl-D-erythritol 4-phosphate cytidylyltransferase